MAGMPGPNPLAVLHGDRTGEELLLTSARILLARS